MPEPVEQRAIASTPVLARWLRSTSRTEKSGEVTNNMKRIYAHVSWEDIRRFLIDNSCSLDQALKQGLIGFPKREMFCDAAFTFRMGQGFAGDVTRIEAASVEPCLIDPTNPPTQYGQPVVLAAASGGVRQVLAGDGALTDIYGITVRPFPLQIPT